MPVCHNIELWTLLKVEKYRKRNFPPLAFAIHTYRPKYPWLCPLPHSPCSPSAAVGVEG